MTGVAPVTLDGVRVRIDRLDAELVRLLGAREQLVRQAGRLKTDAGAVQAPARVEQVVARARAAAVEAGATPDVVERTYRAMIAAFIEVEEAATRLGDEPLVQPLEPRHAGELLTLQRAAYVSEARLYRDAELPPLVQTLAELTAELGSGLALKASAGPRLVGAVRGRVEGELLHVGRLTVAPDMQGRGIGTALLAAVERAARPVAQRATLFTGYLSTANLRLYARCGYVEERREQLAPGIVLVHLTKDLVTTG